MKSAMFCRGSSESEEGDNAGEINKEEKEESDREEQDDVSEGDESSGAPSETKVEVEISIETGGENVDEKITQGE